MAGVIVNKLIVGNIGRVYDIRRVGENQDAVVDFTVAVTPRKQVKGEWVDGITNWHNITAWGRLAEKIVESFKSGDRVMVWGREDMKPGYTNKDQVEVPPRPFITADYAGHEISYHAAHSDRVSGGNRENGQQNAAPARRSEPAPKSIDDDDLDLDLDLDLDGSDDTPF